MVRSCRPFRCERETPTQRDFTENLNLTLINKTSVVTPKNSNTGSFTYSRRTNSIYIHTARGGRAVTRKFSFPQLPVYHFSFTWR